MDIAECIYVLTKAFPKAETYGLTAQMRRAAVSVAANIAEGYGRDTSGAFVGFLRVSQGSLKEIETQLLLAARVGLVDEPKIERTLQLCDELGRMLRSLMRSIQAKSERDVMSATIHYSLLTTHSPEASR